MTLRYLTLAACLLFPPAALAQASAPYEPPRTREGQPDFQGVWASVSITATERPEGVAMLTPTREEADKFVKEFWEAAPDLDDPDIPFANVRTLSVVKGALRTSHIVVPTDGRLPFTEAGAVLSAKGNDSSKGRNDHPEERPVYERCLGGLGHAPIRAFPLLIPTMIVQTRDALAFWTEDVAGFRTVHLNHTPPPPIMRSYDGWSSGRWEGDTLVIETTHFHPDDHWRNDFGRPIVLDADSKVIERLTLVSNAELLYQFTVEDADLYAQPWLAEFSFTRHDGPVYEYACHEANYSIVNVLLAGRVADAKAKPAPKK